MVRQREIIQGKVVQTGSYPADWSQNSSLEVTAQVQLQLCGNYEQQSVLWRVWVTPGRTNWEDGFCVLVYWYVFFKWGGGLKHLCICSVSGEGNGTPLQYSCLENPMDGGAWWAAVHGVTKSRTLLSDFTFTFYFHSLEKEMATHSSVLAWRIPGTGEPGGLPSKRSHRVRHDWSNLAAAAATTFLPLNSYITWCYANYHYNIINLFAPQVYSSRKPRETTLKTQWKIKNTMVPTKNNGLPHAN